MIIYDLRCTHAHLFEGWFKTAKDFVQQNEGGLLSCPVCGTSEVIKLPTASRINRHSSSQRASSGHMVNVEQALLARIHDYVDTNFVDVGAEFPEQARRIHYGERESAAIRGVATINEAKELHDEGIEIVALPLISGTKEKLN